jgi:peroxygenase
VGFRKTGFNPILSFIAIFVIHGTFSLASQDTWFPDFRMPIYVKNMHLTKHGSDSEVYDTEGRFVPVHSLKSCLSICIWKWMQFVP